MGEHIQFVDNPQSAAKGSLGLMSQLPGLATTVGNLASATGGIKPGNIVTTDR